MIKNILILLTVLLAGATTGFYVGGKGQQVETKKCQEEFVKMYMQCSMLYQECLPYLEKGDQL